MSAGQSAVRVHCWRAQKLESLQVNISTGQVPLEQVRAAHWPEERQRRPGAQSLVEEQISTQTPKALHSVEPGQSASVPQPLQAPPGRACEQ